MASKLGARRFALIAIFFFLVALALRVWGLDRLSLWLDEGATVHFAGQTLAQIWRDCFTHEPNPPLYYSLMHYWIELFGDSEFVLRLPSAICSALTVGLIFGLGAKYFSERVGVLAATFVVGLPLQLQYAQEARSYALFCLLSVLVVYLTPIDLRWKSRWHRLLFFAANCALLLTHFFAVWLVLAQALVLLVTWRSRRLAKANVGNAPSIMAFVVGSILSTSPWYFSLLANLSEFRRQVNWIGIYPLTNPLHFLEIFFGMTSQNDWAPRPWPMFGALLALALVVVALISLRIQKLTFWSRLKQFEPATWYLVLWASLSTLVPLAVGRLGPRLFVLRYGLASASALYLLVAALLLQGARRRRFLSLLLLTSACQFYFVREFYGHASKQDWRSAVHYIQDTDPALPILVFPKRYMVQEYYSYSVVDYYAHRLMKTVPTIIYLDKSAEAVTFLKVAGPSWMLMIDWFNDDLMKTDVTWASLRVSDEQRYRDVLLRKADLPR